MGAIDSHLVVGTEIGECFGVVMKNGEVLREIAEKMGASCDDRVLSKPGINLGCDVVCVSCEAGDGLGG